MCSHIFVVTNVEVIPEHKESLMNAAKREKVPLSIDGALEERTYSDADFVILCYRTPFTTELQNSDKDVIVPRHVRVRGDSGALIQSKRRLRIAGSNLGTQIYGLTITNDTSTIGEDACQRFLARVKPIGSLPRVLDLPCRLAIVLGRDGASDREMLSNVIHLIYFCYKDF